MVFMLSTTNVAPDTLLEASPLPTNLRREELCHKWHSGDVFRAFNFE